MRNARIQRAHIAVLFALVALPHGGEAKTFRGIALGDFGTGGYAYGAHAEVSSALSYHDVAADSNVQFTLSTGDNFYIPASEGFPKSLEGTWRKAGSHGGGLWIVIHGNHDPAEPQMGYTNKWHFPSRWYKKVVDSGLGFTVEIFGIDTSESSEVQKQFLEKGLKESTARWRFILTHFPYIGSGRHPRLGTPRTIAAIAKKYGAQLYFNGHDHIVQTCIEDGVAFITTGGVSRGGMLARGLDEDKTAFLLTIGTKTSVGLPGFVHLAMTKNVLWGSTVAYGGVVHEFVTVWDWYSAYKEYPAPPGGKQANSFPSPAVVRRYLEEEAGMQPSGGTPAPLPTSSSPSSSSIGTANATTLRAGNGTNTTAPPLPASPAKENASSLTTPEEENQNKNPIISSALSLELDREDNMFRMHPSLTHYARYVVASEDEFPRVGDVVTVWVHGVVPRPQYRLLLSYSEYDCLSSTKPSDDIALVEGTQPRNLTDVVLTFLPTGPISYPRKVFVCLSADYGSTYTVIRQAATNTDSFTLFPRDRNFVFKEDGRVGRRITGKWLATEKRDWVVYMVAATALCLLCIWWVLDRHCYAPPRREIQREDACEEMSARSDDDD